MFGEVIIEIIDGDVSEEHSRMTTATRKTRIQGSNILGTP